MGERMSEVTCGYRKCGKEFKPSPYRFKYCCDEHKFLEQLLKRNEKYANDPVFREKVKAQVRDIKAAQRKAKPGYKPRIKKPATYYKPIKTTIKNTRLYDYKAELEKTYREYIKQYFHNKITLEAFKEWTRTPLGQSFLEARNKDNFMRGFHYKDIDFSEACRLNIGNS
jgi:hypothetical protein